MSPRIWMIALGALWLAACDSDPVPAGPLPADAAVMEDAYQFIGRDTAAPGPRLTDGGLAMAGQYGAPCAGDDDCDSGVCVPDGDGGICSAVCLSDCRPFPPGRSAYCRSDPSRGRIEFVCYPNQDLLCQACVDDSQCDGAPCIETADGRRCGRPCSGAEDCPDEFTCAEGNCQPSSGSCDCNASTAGASRVCETSNEFGTCIGEETCDPVMGWTGCNAVAPQEEFCDGTDQNCDGIADDGIGASPCTIDNQYGSCDGISVCLGEEGTRCYGEEAAEEICDLTDNDCDGTVDEGFVLADGRYGDSENCGSCGIRCEGRIANATNVGCDAEREVPTCVALRCEQGFQILGGEACVPLRDVTCQACTDMDSCASRAPGAACVTIGDPAIPETRVRVCGRDCGPDSVYGRVCPEGFECQNFGEGEDLVQQCLPAMGHCLCQDNAEGFSLPCTVTSPLNEALTCNGRRSCDGNQFGECVLPSESCDGIDNDCDGVIDNGFRSGDGRYDLDPLHCGRCNFDCAMLQFDNAQGVCEREAAIPNCEMQCNDGFVDLDNGTDDGCECALVPGEDHPDGLDQNCDGIDGDRSRALFVSKVGDDFGAGTVERPLLTIGQALRQAADPNVDVRDIYVATGVYSENLTLVDGVNVYGGYALGFRTRDHEEHPTTLLGRPPEAGAQGTVTANGIQSPTRLDGFAIYGANAAVAGANSIAVLITNSGGNLVLSNNDIIAGNGGPGGRGNAGLPGTSGAEGAVGEPAESTNTVNCRNASTSGGAGGARQCGRQNVGGGDGGSGACPRSQDQAGNSPCSTARPNECRNSCSRSPCNPLPPPQGVGSPGQGPGEAPAGGPAYDRWSSTGLCGQCGLFPSLSHLGQSGTDGPDGVDGIAGQGCLEQAGSLDQAFRWTTALGQSGRIGGHGTGGGGGSAGSGYDAVGVGNSCIDNIGGAGGGGGSAGCGASPGAGGQGGGGSFAVLIAFGPAGGAQLPQLTDNRIRRGVGGTGGTGGAGGIGGLGAQGANGGLSSQVFCSEPGGRGGNGGDGGHGGGGGGGCGGISASIYVSGAGGLDAQGYVAANDLVESGRAGTGGPGGGSTGNPGTAGVDGLLVGVSVQ